MPPSDRQLPLISQPREEWPVVHPEALPPRSDETKGPLSAIEAGRVTSGQSILFGGHLFERGLVHCRGCADWQRWPAGDVGSRRTIYRGTPHDRFIGRCGICGVAVVGEDPRAASGRPRP